MGSRGQLTTQSDRPPIRRTGIFLGADAGGSHTTVVIGTADLTILGRADGPPAAMKPGGAPASAAVLSETGRRAAAHGGIDLPVEGALVAAAGAGRPQERADLEAALVQAGLARRVRVMADGEVALSTAFADGTGIIVSAGTGSIAYARDPAGQLHRAGGYGWQLGDEGGGYWLGRRALAAAARANDGLEESSTLLERLLVALGLRTFDDLIRWTATATPAQVAALAPHVLNAAREGEMVAQRIVADGAVELSQLVKVLTGQFSGGEPIKMATTGGLLRPGSPLLSALRLSLSQDLPRARLSESGSSVDAPVGALRLAAKLLAT